MRKSLLSSLKVVAMMLATDNELHPKEQAWFMAITKNHGASIIERAELKEYLNGRPTKSFEEILCDVVEENDKRRLLNFVQMAMRQDGIVKNSEIQFFYAIQKALENNLQNDYLELGRELLKRDKEMRVWRELELLGKMWSYRARGMGISGHFYYFEGEGVFWESLSHIIGNHKKKICIISATIALIAFVALNK